MKTKFFYNIYFHGGLEKHTSFPDRVVKLIDFYGFSTTGVDEFVESGEPTFFGEGFNITRTKGAAK